MSLPENRKNKSSLVGDGVPDIPQVEMKNAEVMTL